MIDVREAAQPLKPWQFTALELRLEVGSVDASVLEAALRRLEDEGIEITTLASEAQRQSRALERVYELHSNCFRRQPPVELQRIPAPFHLWRWACLEGAEALPEAYFIAREGRAYVGVSMIGRLRRLPAVLECRFTGVSSQCAGRGIGLGLKAWAVRYAIEHGYRELRCTVFAQNGPMLAINETLGFRVERQFVQGYPQLSCQRSS